LAEEIILQLNHVYKHFPVTSGFFRRKKVADVQAVTDVSLNIHRGETLGLVGESGCGKTTLGKCILQLHRPTSGEILYLGQDLCNLDEEQLRPFRQKIQVIFQDPYDSLNPRFTAADIIGEPLQIQKIDSGNKAKISEIIHTVGLAPYMAERYPHEFSGGQRQRLGIARALILRPDLIICDEPLSALDVSIQAQIVNLLVDLKKRFNVAYIFISHDLSIVRQISDRVAIMYLGRVVELADCDEFYEKPMHPYTEALLSAVPIPDPEVEARRSVMLLKGEVPSPLNPPTGCVFHPRCPKAFDDCPEIIPVLAEATPRHKVACLLYKSSYPGQTENQQSRTNVS
jgi:peptide/nickel transport system ATP-binding protein/oligopeptide transport system ATP-binding protein